jgi:myo-inositol 2-dehydrogenase/D-chiro-inositol 1-dehydrogenase
MKSQKLKECVQKAYNRREFIKKSSMTGGSLLILNSSVAFCSKTNSKIEVGIIGLGGRGKLIGTMLKEHQQYQVVSCADYFPEVTRDIGRELGVSEKRQFSGLLGYKKLLAEKLDAVFLETPPYCFPEHVSEAAQTGCHVYIAKPLGCDVPGCLIIKKIADKVKKDKRVFLVDFQTRTEPLYIEAIQRVHNGDIGEIGMLSVNCFTEGFEDKPKTDTIADRLRNLMWVNDINLGCGYIGNHDIHAIDVALWLAKDIPLSAAGSSRIAYKKTYGDAERYYSLTFQFKDGLIANLYAEHTPNTHDWGIHCNALGSQGYLETMYAGKVWIRSNKRPFRGGECPQIYNDGIKRNLDTFDRCIRNNDYSNTTVAPSVNATLASILGREAAVRNTKLTMDELIAENKRLEVDYTGLRQ